MLYKTLTASDIREIEEIVDFDHGPGQPFGDSRPSSLL